MQCPTADGVRNTNKQLSEHSFSCPLIFNEVCRTSIISDASSLISDLAEMGQKVKEGCRISSLSQAAAGNKVQVTFFCPADPTALVMLMFADNGRKEQCLILEKGGRHEDGAQLPDALLLLCHLGHAASLNGLLLF